MNYYFFLLLGVALTSVIFHLTAADDEELNNFCIRDDILLGVGSASYQIEGAWNYGDKSENIWDDLTHNYPTLVSGEATGDVTANSFNKIDEDVADLQQIGVQFYQFSLSWSRLLPSGYSNNVSVVGLKYYNDLIDALVAADIIPMIVLYHWDLPTSLQKLGGWVSTELIDLYADYAQVAFENFGDRVKYWITFSSPSEICKAYGSDHRAPANVYYQTGIGEYICSYVILKAHAKVYHLYDDNYRVAPNGNGTIGIALFANWYEPDTVSSADTLAALRILNFEIGLFANPIFTSEGDYPSIVKDVVKRRSSYEGFPYSRLPELSADEIEYIKFTSDFFGVNHFTTYIAADNLLYDKNPEYYLDLEATYWQRTLGYEETVVDWIMVVPWGFRKLMAWLQSDYGGNGIQFYITQNGYPDSGDLRDSLRISYIQNYVSALLDAINDGVNVGAYTYWNFLDGFEWLYGYDVKFGLVKVNMYNSNRTRNLKSSALFYKKLIQYRTLALDLRCNNTTETKTITTSLSSPETTLLPTSSHAIEPIITVSDSDNLASTLASSHTMGTTLAISMVPMVVYSIIRR